MEKSSITNLIYRVKKEKWCWQIKYYNLFSGARDFTLVHLSYVYMFEVRVGMEHTKKIDLYVCYTFLFGLFAGANQIKKKSFNFN